MENLQGLARAPMHLHFPKRQRVMGGERGETSFSGFASDEGQKSTMRSVLWTLYEMILRNTTWYSYAVSRPLMNFHPKTLHSELGAHRFHDHPIHG